jgi:signal transduction histidine kinase
VVTGSLRESVMEVLSDAAGPLGFTPRLRLHGPLETAVPPDIAGHLLATLREALANVARHAFAHHADVLLDVGPHLLLRVVDDGVGMEVEAGRRRGLRQLEDRAAALGGTVVVENAAKRGTVLVWRVPLPRPPPANAESRAIDGIFSPTWVSRGQ